MQRVVSTKHDLSSIVTGLCILLLGLAAPAVVSAEQVQEKKLAYIVSDARIPFWDIMWRGINSSAKELGYTADLYSAENSTKRELESVVQALKEGVSGIIVSPTTSSACVTILKLAKKKGVPVVISDIGTDGGEYVSFISSNNLNGAYEIGLVLGSKLRQLGRDDGRVGIISIPQKRKNGQARTAGFMRAMDEYKVKGADLKQQADFSHKETYDYSMMLIRENADLRAIWLQGSDRYQGALDAIKESGKKGEILLLTFDAEPEFLDLIPQGVLLGAAMQQPYLMGEQALRVLDQHLKGEPVEKKIELPVLAISTDNIKEMIPTIRRNVLGIEAD